MIYTLHPFLTLALALELIFSPLLAQLLGG